MGTNRYYGDFEINQFGRVEYRDVGYDGTFNGSFSYQHIGRTTSGHSGTEADRLLTEVLLTSLGGTSPGQHDA